MTLLKAAEEAVSGLDTPDRRQTLIDVGILTENGKLAPEYGGGSIEDVLSAKDAMTMRSWALTERQNRAPDDPVYVESRADALKVASRLLDEPLPIEDDDGEA